MDSNGSLWVFGYGSLCWHPGFQTTSSSVGYVRNYVRRFWQGNTTHRGMPGKVSQMKSFRDLRRFGLPFGTDSTDRFLLCAVNLLFKPPPYTNTKGWYSFPFSAWSSGDARATRRGKKEMKKIDSRLSWQVMLVHWHTRSLTLCMSPRREALASRRK